MFAIDTFLDDGIQGISSDDHTPQPINKQKVLTDLRTLIARITTLLNIVNHSKYEGKIQHLGFGFFNANDWIEFADMHHRHYFSHKLVILKLKLFSLKIIKINRLIQVVKHEGNF